MRSRTSSLRIVIATLAAVLVAVPAFGQTSPSVTFLFSNGGNDVTMDIVQGGPGALSAANALTAVFFDVTGNRTLSVLSATIGSGSSLEQNGSTITGSPLPDVSSHWAYKVFSSPVNGGQSQGVSAAGLSSNTFVGFGGGTLFDNTTATKNNLDGVDYALVSSSTDTTLDGFKTSPVIADEVLLKFTGALGLTANDFTNFAYNFGTAPGEGGCTGNCGDGFVPEPAYYQLGSLMGLGGLGLLRLRRRKTTDA